MKNQNIIYLILTVVLIGGVVYAFSQMSTKDKDIGANDDRAGVMEKEDTVKKNDTAMMEDVGDEKMMEEDSDTDGLTYGELLSMKYPEYSPEVFEANSENTRVIFFYASWCPTCRPADEEFSNTAFDIPDGVVLFKANYDTEKELKTKYGVTYQHTFVQVDSNGDMVTKWSGGSLQELLENIVL